jgi:hypothetical protein
LLLGAGILGCEQAPAEPTRAASAKPRVRKERLVWNVPPGWNVERTADSGMYRGKYSIPTSGDAKHPAEILVWTVGNDKDLVEAVTDLVGGFEGKDVQAAEDTLTAGTMTVNVTEVAGRYKFPVGPPMGKKKKHAAHVIKDDWRAIVATVKVPKRGRWVFRLVGPSDTVMSARSAFRAMLEGLK